MSLAADKADGEIFLLGYMRHLMQPFRYGLRALQIPMVRIARGRHRNESLLRKDNP